MDHLWSLNKLVHKSIETSIVEADDQEGVDRTDRVIRLLFFNVGVVWTHQYQRLDDLDVVEVANETILAVSYATSKINHAEHAINKLDTVNEKAYLEKDDTTILVLVLDFS